MPLEIIRNDITKMECDAIVNPTDSAMSGSGGTDFAVHTAAGPGLREECDSLGGLGEGQTAITHAFNLPCRYVIHTVGPQKDENGYVSYGALENCYRNSLALAAENGCQSIAFPLIATGTFGFPKDKGIDIAVKEIERFLADNDMLVYLVVHDEEGYSISKSLRDDIADYISGKIIAEPSAFPKPDAAPLYAGYRGAPPAQNKPRREKLRDKLSRLTSPRDESEDFDFLPSPDEEKHEKRRKKDADASAQAPLDYSKLDSPSFSVPAPAANICFNEAAYESDNEEDLKSILKDVDESFSQMLLRKIDEKNMTDAQCYKKANIDRRLFSRIRGDINYKPSKSTALAFAIALELPLGETNEMLRKAGFALSHSSRADIIVEYFIEKKIYNIMTINEALFEFDQALLGGSKGL